jgi:hypothetical protein
MWYHKLIASTRQAAMIVIMELKIPKLVIETFPVLGFRLCLGLRLELERYCASNVRDE